MKKIILILLALVALAFSNSAVAQSAKISKDSTIITYQKSTYKIGDTVQFWYGSGANKNFEFVTAMNFSTLKNAKASSDFSKHKFVINREYVDGGKCFIGGKANWISDDNNYIKVSIDLEGAVDNKEIVEPNNIVTPVVAKAPVKKKHN